MPHDRPASFRFIGPDGAEIANGPLSLLDEALRARSTAEGAIAAAARAAGQMARIEARSDALDRKERDLERREDACRAIQSDAIRRFADGVLELRHRLDRIERQRIADALRDLPDSDDPEGRSENQRLAEADYLSPAPLPPPHGDEQEVETVLERERGDQGDLAAELLKNAPPQPGNYQTLDEPPKQVSQPIAVSLTSADGLGRDDFVCGRDLRKWKRQQSRRWK
jgi:hypothetical protein